MKTRFVFILFLSFLSISKASQPIVLTEEKASKIHPNASIIRLTNFSKFPNFIEFIDGREISEESFTAFMNTWSKQNHEISFKSVNSSQDEFGNVHTRYQQIFQNIPVAYVFGLTHSKNGKIYAINGDFVDQINLPSVQAQLTEQEALSQAMDAIGARIYKWQQPQEEKFIKWEKNDQNATFFPKGELVIINKNLTKETNPEWHLVYKFDIYASEPHSRDWVYIDATTGELIFKESRILHADFSGTANTAYSGSRTIKTSKDATGSFILRETGRGNGIETYNLNQGTFYNYAEDFIDSDNNWNNLNPAIDQYALDAHWGAEMTYDYYLNKHNRNGIDGSGFALKSYVHYSTNFDNAFWDGERMNYGDGNLGDYPLTSLDITGHEITHGLIANTATLINSDEPGALNESFADIFGVSIDFYARPDQANFTIAEEVSSSGNAIRSLSDPKSLGQPDTYGGSYWQSGGTFDAGGVHINSGVQNYWFYLLVNGGTGRNDNSNNYSVTGIGIDKASKIAFRVLTTYLTSSSHYIDAYFYSIQAAKDLFGDCSQELIATQQAWFAVGIGPSSGQNEPNETMSTATDVNTNTNINGQISSSSDKDYYKFTVSSTGDLSLVLSNLPKNYDLKLYNVSGTLLGQSIHTGTTPDTITKTNLSAGTYYALVCGVSGANNNSCYTLKISTFSGQTCSNNYEPNESKSSAYTLPLNTDITGQIAASSDKDYYKFVLTSAQNIELKLNNLPANYNLKLYSSSGSLLGSSLNTGTNPETITKTGLNAGTYIAYIYSPYGYYSNSQCYSFRVSTSSSSSARMQGGEDDDMISAQGLKHTSISAYPNPASKETVILVESAVSGQAHLSLIDPMGRKSIEKVVNINNGETKINLPLINLPGGVYLVRLEGDFGHISQRLMIE